MICMWVAFHENNGNHEKDEDDSDSYKKGVECWINGNHGNHGNYGNDENHGNPGCKPRVPETTGLEIPDFLVIPTQFIPHKQKKLAVIPSTAK